MRICLPFFALFLILLSSCVTQDKYEDLTAQNKYLQSQMQNIDSLQYEYQALNEKYRQSDALLRSTTQELEQKAVANRSLNQSYQDLLNRYNQLVEQSKNVLSTSSYEKLGLQEQLSAQQSELDRRARELAVMEYELNQREARLGAMEYNYNNLEGNLAERNQRIMELEAMLANNESTIQLLRTSIDEALVGFDAGDLTVEERDGKLYVSLSQELLFRSGSDNIDAKGRRAIQQLATVLKQNPEIDVTVEGHTDNVGSAATNWDLSVQRATSVVKVLTASGVDPERITAAGRGFYAPVATNSTAVGRAQNRRTEIILSPNLDRLYQLMDGN